MTKNELEDRIRKRLEDSGLKPSIALNVLRHHIMLDIDEFLKELGEEVLKCFDESIP